MDKILASIFSVDTLEVYNDAVYKEMNVLYEYLRISIVLKILLVIEGNKNNYVDDQIIQNVKPR